MPEKSPTTQKPPIRRLKLSELQGAKYNPRAISAKAFAGLGESIKAFGLLELPVVNTRGGTNRIVSGHQRVKRLLADGVQEADCITVDYDDVTERMANLSMNNPAVRGKWDVNKAVPMMAATLKAVPKSDPMMLHAMMKSVKQYVSRNPEARKSERRTVAALAIPPVSKINHYYKLGNHRLYCGDALKPGAIAGLVQGFKVAATLTDPPYNVAYAPDAKVEIKNDEQDPKAFAAFCDAFCAVIAEHCRGPLYCFFGSKEMPVLASAWAKAGGTVARWLAWVKDHPVVNSFRPSDFNSQFEWVMFGHTDTALHDTPAARKTNVLDYPKPSANKLHPTMKPLPMFIDLIRDCTSIGDAVLDIFAGSGTLVEACEALQRVALMAELDPRYCDVIRKRWAEKLHGAGADWQKLTPAI